MICRLTSVDLLVNRFRDRAFISFRESLTLQLFAVRAKAARLHGSLKSVPFPSEDVVSMLAISSPEVKTKVSRGSGEK